jgi:hypothetical protein
MYGNTDDSRNAWCWRTFCFSVSPAGRGSVVTSPVAVMPSGTIRSQSDLQRYVSETASSPSPLNALSSGVRARFLSSITFNGKGITGFNYDDLQSELTASQMVAVLHLFGVENDVKIIPNVRVEAATDRRRIRTFELIDPSEGTDLKGHWCTRNPHAVRRFDSICTGQL